MKINKAVYINIIAHAVKEKPIEACGYLASQDDIVTVHFEMTNTDNSPEHFSFDPEEQFEVYRKVQKLGMTIMANYHSHPETPARPSLEDIKLAFDPDISYVIVSIANDTEDVKAFRKGDSEVTMNPIELIITT